MQTPLCEEIEKGLELKFTMPTMGTPLREEIKEGIKLNPIFKHMQTPLREEIEGVELKATMPTMY